MTEMNDRDLERVAGGKELRRHADLTLTEARRAVRSVQAAADNASGLMNEWRTQGRG
jgi:hypothetical protein